MKSSMIVYNEKYKIRQWVSDRLKMDKIGNDMFEAIGLIKNDELIAGIVFHDYKGYEISCSLATTSKNWCTKRILEEGFHYPFVTCNVERLFVRCRRGNKKVKKLLKRMGFKFEGVARKGFDGKQDAFFFSMLKNECKWINHGRKSGGSPSRT